MGTLSAEKKVEMIKRHSLGRETVSDLCREYNVSPKRYHEWQKKFFEEGAQIFENSGGRKESSAAEIKRREEKIRALEGKLNKKHEVLSELMEEHVALKKSFGGI